MESDRVVVSVDNSSGILSNKEILPWYALHVRPRYEKQISQILKSKGFEEFLPLYTSRRRWSDRWKTVEFPLFPGYMFCRLNEEIRLPVLTIPGVICIVGVGGHWIPVSEQEIQAVLKIVKSGLAAEPWPYLKSGQRVLIAEGKLAGLEGIFLKKKGAHRLVITIELLQRSVAVEIDASWVRPTN
jgi:transcription antitermination factor NusG